MQITIVRFKLVAVCFATLLCVGCGGGDDYVVPELTKVSGTVTMDGKPLEKVTVIYTPQAGTQAIGGIGVTDSSGKYTLTHKSDQPGVEPGKYDVTFSKWAMPDGSPIPEGKTAADVEAKQMIPDVYTIVTQSGSRNIAEVKAGEETIDFELKSK